MRFDSEWQGQPSPYLGRHRKTGLPLRLALLHGAGQRGRPPRRTIAAPAALCAGQRILAAGSRDTAVRGQEPRSQSPADWASASADPAAVPVFARRG